MAAERPSDAELRPRDQVIAELQSLCAARRTGTLFIITLENHPAQVILREGEIVGLSYRLMRGPDALAPLQAFSAARYRFESESVQSADARLPATADVLAHLGAAAATVPGPPPPAFKPETGAAPTTRPPAEAAEAIGRIRAVLERELAEFLGPMAGMICQEYLAAHPALGSPQDATKLVEAIAREIGDPAKEAHFKQRVLSQLPDA